MREFDHILAELDWPMIFLVSAKQFEKIDGDRLEGSCGISNINYNIITISRGLRGKVLKNTIWHEIFHILFPSWNHWKIEAAAERMARGGGRGVYCSRHGHTVDEMPSRKELLIRARRAALRHNRKHNILQRS